jgi:hypothetical protein
MRAHEPQMSYSGHENRPADGCQEKTPNNSQLSFVLSNLNSTIEGTSTIAGELEENNSPKGIYKSLRAHSARATMAGAANVAARAAHSQAEPSPLSKAPLVSCHP